MNIKKFTCFIFSKVGLKNCFISPISILSIPSLDHLKSRDPNWLIACPIWSSQ